MKTTILAVMILMMGALSGPAQAAVVWENDCSSLDGWGYASGNGVGVTVVNSSYIQMNSWANNGSNAGWTNLWRNTGLPIKSNAEYKLTLRLSQFAAGTTVPVSLQNASASPWSIIVQQDIAFEGTWADYSVTFSTDGGANSSAVGGQLAIGVSPGWWKNFGIEQVTVEETILAGPKNPSPAHDANPTDDVDAAGAGSTENPGKVKVDLAWDTMEDPEQPGVIFNQVTKHYLYFKANDPNFANITPDVIPAGSPIIARPSVVKDNLDYNGVYYWQVKESINDSGPSDVNTVAGPVWAFETIQESPIVITSPTDILVAENNPATFTATVVSTSPITCNWYISDDSVADPLNDTLLGTTSVASYTITSTPMNYAGKYVYFVVSNSSPQTDTSEPALLEVKRLIGWWKMDNNLDDSSGNDWNGMYSPLFTAAYDNGLNGSALSLPNDPNHLVTVVGSEDAFNFYHLGMTVSAWVKSSTPDWSAIVSKEDRNGDYEGWELMLDWQGYPSFAMVGGGSSSGTPAINVSDGQWHLLTAVYDAATRIPSLYVDGELKSSGTAGSETLLPSPAPVFIGALLENGNTPYGGLIDDVRIYTYPKLNTEVVDLYNEFVEPDKQVCILGYTVDVDLNGDCQIDLGDLADLAAGWLTCGRYPECQ